MVIVISGVAGIGTDAIARALAGRLHFEFFAGDDFHTRENRQMVQSSAPLTNADHESWLIALSDLVSDLSSCGVDAVLMCSGMPQSYRDVLAHQGVHFVFFHAATTLQASHFESLDGHDERVTIDANQPIEAVVEDLLRRLGLTPA
jgi:carbohydrate kinase (thermoresistant glucokinase family)